MPFHTSLCSIRAGQQGGWDSNVQGALIEGSTSHGATERRAIPVASNQRETLLMLRSRAFPSPENHGIQVLRQSAQQLLQAVRSAQHGRRGRGRAGGGCHGCLLLGGLPFLVASSEDAAVAPTG